MPSDAQADRLYRAEQTVKAGAQLYAADQVHRYIGHLTSTDWWAGHGWPPVAVRIGRTANAWGGRLQSGSWYIGLPGWANHWVEQEAREAVFARRPVEWPWAWCERVVCHELAHVTVMAGHDGRTLPPAHGAIFATRYLHVVEAVMGPLARWKLERAFERGHVAHGEPGDHDDDPVGPEALEAALWRPYRPSRPARSLEAAQGILTP